MGIDHWRQLTQVFHAAAALPAEERAAYLAQACAGEETLRREVEDLLRADNGVEPFLDSDSNSGIEDLVLELASPAAVGRRFGPYRVSTEIGRGGMAAVFLGERVDGQFEQRVAIKLIKRGMDTAHILERFRMERQILASLEHPNIARLLDGGTTEEGLPYFVMEHIEGLPIDRYADEHRLSVRERLELFLQVCEAVSYAHRHLVVHRDIKPHNILVTSAGTPKLLDFGIAKVLQEAGDPGTATISGFQLLTPDYASPEQVEGRPTTTQTDVYSLGVVLYELLTGRSPYRPRTWSTRDVCESVLRSEVERPSTAVTRAVNDAPIDRRRTSTIDRSGALGAGTVARLRAQLRGDLDAIVMSALRKECERRYPSVEQLAGDVRRHLNGLPVRARADSLWYRGAKFVARNRVAVAAGVLVAVALVGGTIATAWQALEAREQARLAHRAQERAERQFSEVRKLANALIFEYHDSIKDLPGATPVRARLVRDALGYLDRLAEEAGAADTALQRELALAYRKVGEVQGGGTRASLGDTKGAIESYQKSLQIFEALLARQPDDGTTQRDVATLSLDLASLVRETGDMAQARALANRGRSLFESLAPSSPDLDLRLALAGMYDTAGVIELHSGNLDAALDVHRRGVHLLESTPASDHSDPRVRRALAGAHHHIGDVQSAARALENALESYRSSLRLSTALSTEFPMNTDYRRLTAGTHFWEGGVLAELGRLQEALEATRRSLAIAEDLAAADPEAYNGDVAYGILQVGSMHSLLGDHGQALEHYQRAQSIRADDVKADPTSLWKRAALIDAHARICQALTELGRDDEGLVACTETAELLEHTTLDPENAQYRTFVADCYFAVGEGYAAFARRDPSGSEQRERLLALARDMYARSHEIWTDMAARAIIAPLDAKKPAEVSRALADTETALRELASPRAELPSPPGPKS